MASNKVQDGNVLIYSNTGSAIASGGAVVMQNLLGIALADIAATPGSGPVAIGGVWEVPAASGAWLQGEAIYYSAGDANFTATSTGNVFAGYAAAAKSTSEATGRLLLNGLPG